MFPLKQGSFCICAVMMKLDLKSTKSLLQESEQMLQRPSLSCHCTLQWRSWKDWNLYTDRYGAEQDDER